jgi:sugar/nucleoside kinase (ribokinase family)
LTVDVISLGEALIDFISLESGVSLEEAPGFEKCPGGAPANFAVACSRLGIPTGFIGKVGDDAFGRFLADTLRQNGVDVSQVKYSEFRTALAFVSIAEDGERHFMFYRRPCADAMLEEVDIDSGYISQAKVLHFGTVGLSESPSREATLKAVEYARESGVKVSFDPNIRFHLWPKDPDEIRDEVIAVAKSSDIFLPSREEAEFLVGMDPAQALEEFLSWGPGTVGIKLGRDGCLVGQGEQRVEAPGIAAEALDTTGAGDGFDAGFIYGLLQGYPLQKTALNANVVGSLVVRKRGAMTSLPVREDVESLVSEMDA